MLHIWNIIVFTGLHIATANEYLSVARRYILHLSPSTWEQGQSGCGEAGGKLATIYDYSTVPDLNLEADYPLKTGRLFWIGLYWSLTDQGYAWDNGDNITWYNWRIGVNASHTDPCVAVSSTKRYSWEAVDCEKKLPYLCQHKDGECRFVTYPNMSIASHNYMYLYDKSEEHCKNVCSNELGTRCRSFDYFPADGRCEFNSGDRWTLDDYFSYRQGWVHFHRTCNSGCLQTSNVLLTSTYFVTSTVGMFVPVTRDVIVTSTHVYRTTLTVTESSTHMIIASSTVFLPSVSVGEDPVEELKEIGVKAIEKKKTLKKISMKDNRPSARYVGYVAIVFMTLVFGSIILFDLTTLYRHRRRCFKKKRHDSKQQKDHSNLQKSFDLTETTDGTEENLKKMQIQRNVRQSNLRRLYHSSERSSSHEDPCSSSAVYQRSGQRSKMIWRPFVLNLADSGIEGSEANSSPCHSDSGSDTFHFSFHRNNEIKPSINVSDIKCTIGDEEKSNVYQITKL